MVKKHKPNLEKQFAKGLHKNRIILFVLGFAIIGSVTLLITHAAGPTVSLEAENGTITGPAVSCGTDNTASNNGCVQFKKAVTGTAPGIYVSGTKLVNGQGTTIILHGANRSGPEYMCASSGSNLVFDGPNDSASLDAMATWHINAVRIPVSEDCWLGINGLPNAGYSAASYRQAIVTYINLLHSKGMYAILDLQWTSPGTIASDGTYANKGLAPMLDEDHAPAFWTSAANTFKNDPSTLFDAQNEPYPDSNNSNSTAAWTCWKNGGASTSTCPGSSLSYTVAGMQEIVTTIRATGANNVIMLGGINYSNGLLQWTAFKPTDPANQLAASFHNYLGNSCNTTTCYNTIYNSLTVPLIAGEFGEFDSSASFMNTFMTWADSKGVSYLAWTWDIWGCGNGGVLISNYNGTPCSPSGTAYQSHLQTTFPANGPIQ